MRVFYFAPKLRRSCIPTRPCGYKAVGCSWDSDCEPGLGCAFVDGQPTCLDIDECAQEGACDGLPGTKCINLISTYKYVL